MRVSSIIAFRFPTRAPLALSRFYTGLGFSAGEIKAIPADEMEMLGLDGGGMRVPLRLGDQRLDLDRYALRGEIYPEVVGVADTRFQHLAIVTDDVATAWSRAEALGARPISSGGPVTLPEANGGVTAIKFRDPEGRPLEFLQFPIGASRWRGTGLLGIDHTAISVGDRDASQSFYEALGLRVDGATLNQGLAQDVLDGTAGAKVDVVPMLPQAASPHLELLAYRWPTPRRAPVPAPIDVAATRIVWASDSNAVVRDPDGHLHHLTTEG